MEMEPAFTWHGDIEQTISHKEKSKAKTFKHRDQIAAELIYFSDCIRRNKRPEPSGKEGLLDVRIIDALQDLILGIEPLSYGRWRRSNDRSVANPSTEALQKSRHR